MTNEVKELTLEDMTLLNPMPDFEMVPINPLECLFNRQLELIINQIRGVPGDIVELGVHTGNNATQFMWHIPEKKYFGFDTFTGYTKKDMEEDPKREDLKSNMTSKRWNHQKEKTVERIEDLNKKINQIARILLADPDVTLIYDYEIVKGDIKRTVPQKIKEGGLSQVSLLYVDCNAYLPSIKAMESIYPILSDGGIICIDEHKDGGETKALNEIAEKYGQKVMETGFNFETGVHSNPSKYIIKNEEISDSSC